MLVPGVIIDSDRLDITADADIEPDYISQGFGFMSDGTLAVDTNTPSGSNWYKGFRLNATGAVFGTATPDSSDVWNAGLRISVDGAIVYEADTATQAVNGDPLTADGNLATI